MDDVGVLGFFEWLIVESMDMVDLYLDDWPLGRYFSSWMIEMGGVMENSLPWGKTEHGSTLS